MSETPDYQTELESLLPRLERIASLDPAALEAEHVAILGRKQGLLTNILRALPGLEAQARAKLGRQANQVKQQFEAAFAARRDALRQAAATARSGLDLTMPGRRRWIGVEHPVTQVTEEILRIFRELGFTCALGPEAETEWLNFGALNFPPNHPALDMHDTFYVDTRDRRLGSHERRRGRSSGVEPDFERRSSAADRRRPESEGRVLLRTHTSPVQIRALLAHKPPVRAVAPGMVYRKDAFDPSHAPAFAQVEGLVVDRGITFVDLKATLIHFAHRFFGPETGTRFRPSYFPFTEPSAEMDVHHQLCQGKGCPVCKGTGWMEILGCGMVHPAVLENCGLDPEEFTGFAFGMGPHRMALQRFGIDDIRLFYAGDMRFLSQFGALGR